MDGISQLIAMLFVAFPFVVGGLLLALIVYLIAKRVDDKRNETFEKRDS